MRKRSYKGLRKLAWDTFSKWIRKRDNGICITCGKKDDIKEMQAGHFVHRDCLDFDERNVNCQCPQCNNYKSGRLEVYAMKLIQMYGAGIVEELNLLGHQVRKFSRNELEQIIEKYK